jgi:hypothetical protein
VGGQPRGGGVFNLTLSVAGTGQRQSEPVCQQHVVN